MLNIVDQIIAYEAGELVEREVVALFQVLLDRDLLRHMEYPYQLTAMYLLEAGMCTKPLDRKAA